MEAPRANDDQAPIFAAEERAQMARGITVGAVTISA